MQYDQRGRPNTKTMNISATGGSLNFPTFPQYQQTSSYNDANLLMTTQTTVGGQAGYTFSQVYNSTTGTLNGLSNNSIGVANLATLSYTPQNWVSDINLLNSTGGALADNNFQYDGDLRVAGTTATWQSGSGQSGTIYSDGVSYDAVGNVTSRVSNQPHQVTANDVHTLFGTSASWYDKLGAGLDLTFNATGDVLLLMGVGEAMRGIALGEHVGADLLEHVGETLAFLNRL